MTDTDDTARADALLDFWFGDGSPAAAQRWFVRDPAFDAEIAARFRDDVDAALAGRLDRWADAPRSWLALLIALDQFPRNLFRNDPRAYAGDPAAQRIALAGIAAGHDRALSPIQRVFAYMPLEHAEDMALQRRCVELMRALAAEAPPAQRETFDGFVMYAEKHADVIARYGRFPHRNAVLGRTSTAEEREYLAQPGAGF